MLIIVGKKLTFGLHQQCRPLESGVFIITQTPNMRNVRSSMYRQHFIPIVDASWCIRFRTHPEAAVSKGKKVKKKTFFF